MIQFLKLRQFLHLSSEETYPDQKIKMLTFCIKYKKLSTVVSLQQILIHMMETADIRTLEVSFFYEENLK